MKKMIILALGIITLASVNTEIDFGLCLNSQGDGKVYNSDPYYNYISYAGTDAEAGDKVLTLFFLNPTNLEPDDYIFRHDWIMRKEGK